MSSIRCKIRTNNTAQSRCKIDLGLYRRCLVIPATAYYVESPSLTFEQWIEKGIHAAKPESRFYPMPSFTNCEDNTEDRVVFTNPYGISTPLRDGNFAFTQSFERDSCLNKKLLAFNNQSFRVIIFDNENNAQVVRTAKGITGELANVYVSQPKANGATDLSEPQISYSFLNPDEHRMREVIPTDLSWGEIKGLEDFIIDVSKRGSDYIIRFFVSCSGDDVTSELIELDGVADAWLFLKAGTTVPTPITPAPTYDQTEGVFVVSSTALGTGKIGIANPRVLFENGVSNVDCPEMFDIT